MLDDLHGYGTIRKISDRSARAHLLIKFVPPYRSCPAQAADEIQGAEFCWSRSLRSHQLLFSDSREKTSAIDQGGVIEIIAGVMQGATVLAVTDDEIASWYLLGHKREIL
jgi:hypothetical protein